MCSSNSSYTMKTLVVLLTLSLVHTSNADIFNVLDCGATADGNTDDSKAFLSAWNHACSSSSAQSHEVIIPPNHTFLLNPVMFNGPCNSSNINFVISGRLVAPSSPSIWTGQDASQWLAFNGVTGLYVNGFGSIDGQGKRWWDQSCRHHLDLPGCTKLAPTSMKFISCNQSSISNINFVNSAQVHIQVRGCNDFKIDHVNIQSPKDSPNTDGIHLQSSQSVIITNSGISSGDDCISIGDHSSYVDISYNPLWTWSGIGSLGKSGNYVQVENINVSYSFFSGTTNGARIKTWQVGTGYVRDVRFENLEFDNVDNPIIIDQNYCDVRGAFKEMPTGVHVSNVVYKKLKGTSSTEIAINLNCSRSVACTDITLEEIELTSTIPTISC